MKRSYQKVQIIKPLRDFYTPLGGFFLLDPDSNQSSISFALNPSRE
jgi:hypothetical protein